MKNPAILIVLLALVLGALGWFAFSDSRPGDLPTEVGGGEVSAAPDTGELRASDASSKKTDVSPVANRESIASGDSKEIDPRYEAAMAGFRGRLVLTDGSPAADREVRFFRFDPEMLQNPGFFAEKPSMDVKAVDYRARSAEDGTFTVTGAWPQSFYLMIADFRGVNQRNQLIENTPGPAQIVDLGDVLLPELGTISGQVLDLDGKPAANALVRAVDLPGPILDMAPVERFDPVGGVLVDERGTNFILAMPAWVQPVFDILPLPTTRTDDKGMFTLTGVQPGSNSVVVNFREHLPLVKKGVQVAAGKEEKVGKLDLEEGEIAGGKVVDSDGNPVVGAEVMVFSKSPTIPVHFGSFAEPTDAKGRFSLAGFPGRPIFVSVRRSPDEAWTIQGPSSVAGDVDVTLPAYGSMTLSVRSELGGVPEDVELKLAAVPGRGPGVSLGLFGFSSFLDVEKRLTRTETGAFQIRDLIAGDYSLVVRAKGHAQGSISFAVPGKQKAEVVLTQAHALSVRTFEDKRPLRNVKLYVSTNRSGEFPAVAGKTDAAGQLEIGDCPKGTVRLTASHPAFGMYHKLVSVPAEAAVRFDFQPAGVLTGELLEGGKPPKPGKLTVTVQRHYSEARGAMPSLPRMVVPDAEGRFKVTGLAPGKYLVDYQPSMGMIQSPAGIMKLTMMARMYRMDIQEVDVVSGAEVHLRIDTEKKAEVTGPSAAVTGTVLINGRVPKGLVLEGWGQVGQVRAEVDASGRFDVGRVAAGYLQLNLKSGTAEGSPNLANRGSLWSYSGQIEADKDLRFEISIDTGSIAGFVVGLDGNPVLGAQVQAMGSVQALTNEPKRKSSVNLMARTDKQGRFKFDQVPAGDYTLQIEGNAGYAHTDNIKVQAALPVIDIRLALSRVYKVAGTLDLSLFENKPTNIHFWVSGKRFNRSTQIKEDGAFEFTDLPPGRYTGQAHGWGSKGSESFQLAEPLVVDRDQTGVTIRLKKNESRSRKR